MRESVGLMQIRSRFLEVVAAIPEGRVTTYGTIAQHLQVTARQVAFLLATPTEKESKRLPWFRVVAANGVVSSTKLPSVGRRQIAPVASARGSLAIGTPSRRRLRRPCATWLSTVCSWDPDRRVFKSKPSPDCAGSHRARV